MLVDRFMDELSRHPEAERDLERLRAAGIPNGYIAAGYFRNYIWDVLHGYPERTPLNDVDVVYYDPDDLSSETERLYEDRLRRLAPYYNWSCKNQARMHLRNREAPYSSVEDAMARWPETATAVGAAKGEDGAISLIAPHGLDDLFGLRIRMSPFYRDLAAFLARVESKGWLRRWPKLVLEAGRESEFDLEES